MYEPAVPVPLEDLRLAVSHLRHRSPVPPLLLARLESLLRSVDTPDLFARPVPVVDVEANTVPRMRTTSSPTARRMRAKVWPTSGSYRMVILRTVAAAGEHGMTDYELEGVLDRSHQSVSGTRNGLCTDGWLEPATHANGTPIERRNRFDNPCQVWRPTVAALRRLSAPSSPTLSPTVENPT